MPSHFWISRRARKESPAGYSGTFFFGSRDGSMLAVLPSDYVLTQLSVSLDGMPSATDPSGYSIRTAMSARDVDDAEDVALRTTIGGKMNEPSRRHR